MTTNPDETFEDAFEAAVAPVQGGEVSAKEPEPVEGQEVADNQTPDEGVAEPTKEGAPGGSQSTDVPPEPVQPAGKPGQETQSETEDDKKGEELITQRYKSLQGMYNSEKKRSTDLEAKLTEMAERLQALEGQPKQQEERKPESKPEAGTAVDPEVAEFEQEYDYVARPIRKMLSSYPTKEELADVLYGFGTQLFNTIMPQISPVIETVNTREAQTHEERIRQAHPDFETYRDSGEIMKWMETQPSYLKTAYEHIYQNGTTDEIIDLLSRFKAENHDLASVYVPEPPAVSPVPTLAPASIPAAPVDKQKLKAMEAVPGRKTPVVTSATNKSADDYEGAFDEALRSLG